MKYILTIISLYFLSFTSFKKDKFPKNLVGTWEFVELLDKNFNHIDTLFEKDGYYIPQGPTWTINSDGTYAKQYTPASPVDEGTWTFNKTKKEVILKLYWKKPYNDMDKYIMTLGCSKQDENGDYYDLIPEKIIDLTAEKLVILEKEGTQRVFRKVTGQ